MPNNTQNLCFVDTNIWLYAIVESSDSDKMMRAREIIQNSNIAVSAQVINEVCFNAFRKAQFSSERIEELIDSFFARHQVIELSREVMIRATRLRKRYSFSFWDSMIVAAALQSSAPTLYSEDLQDGLVVDGQLRIVNPLVKK